MDGIGIGTSGVDNLNTIVIIDNLLWDIVEFIIPNEVGTCLYSGVATFPCTDTIGTDAILMWDR